MYSCNGQNGSFPLKASQGVGRDASDAGGAARRNVEDPGKSQDPSRMVPRYGCAVLEVQDWIDGINHPEWGRLGKQVFGPGGDPYVLQVSHRFSVE